MVKGRTSMGRQKIEMKRIEREEARSVCFSKRRQGMFKKASELSILCGVMVAIVAFSPAGRPFSFGGPSFKSVINRFLALIGPATSGESCDSSSGETNITIKESLECSELEQSIESEKKRKKRLKDAIEHDMDGRLMDWLTTKACPSGLDELYEIQKKLVEIQDVVKEKIKQVLQEERNPTRSYPSRFMDLASKYQLDIKIATPISSIASNYNYGYTDGLDVNYSSASGTQAIGTSVNCPSELDG